MSIDSKCEPAALADPPIIVAGVVGMMVLHVVLYIALDVARRHRGTAGLFGFQLMQIGEVAHSSSSSAGDGGSSTTRTSTPRVFTSHHRHGRSLAEALENLRRWLKYVYVPLGALLYGAIKLSEVLT